MQYEIVRELLENIQSLRKEGFLDAFINFCPKFNVSNDKQDFYALYGDSVLSSEVIRLCMKSGVDHFSTSIGSITQIKSHVVSNDSLGSFYEKCIINERCGYIKVGKRRADYIEAAIGYLSLRKQKEGKRTLTQSVQNLVVEIMVFSLENLLSELLAQKLQIDTSFLFLFNDDNNNEEEEEEEEEGEDGDEGIAFNHRDTSEVPLFRDADGMDVPVDKLFDAVKELLLESPSCNRTLKFKTLRYYLSVHSEERLHRVTKMTLEQLISFFPDDFCFSGYKGRGIVLKNVEMYHEKYGK